MATIKDIATRLGVSVSTVSKGLNGASDISEELRQMVLDTAVEMGYATKKSKKKDNSLIQVISPYYGNFEEKVVEEESEAILTSANEETEETKEPETESKIAKTKKQEEPEQPKKKRGRPKKEKVEEKISFPEKEQQDERVENVNENRVKMPCMPEIKEFEKKLAMVDKTQPVEKRIKFVLDAMGFKQLSEKSQKNIMEIATTAVKSSRMSYDIIAVKAQIQGDSPMTARMEFANFVNNFAKKYDSSAQVKILEFLSDLQKIIMFESEIEDYSDLNEN